MFSFKTMVLRLKSYNNGAQARHNVSSSHRIVPTDYRGPSFYADEAGGFHSPRS